MTKHIWFMDGHCEEDVLHYGVKGMKWGVRKDRKSYSKKLIDYLDKPTIATSSSYYKSKLYNDSPTKKLRDIRRIKPETFDTALSKSNGKTNGHVEEGRELNYANASMALEMRRRGYDVTARRSEIINADNGVSVFFKDAKVKAIKTNQGNKYDDLYKKIEASILKDGDSTGMISAASTEYNFIYNYEVRNGKVTMFDAVLGDKGSSVTSDFNMYGIDHANYVRTDNLSINDDAGILVEESR